jgi:hypothetical protein
MEGKAFRYEIHILGLSDNIYLTPYYPRHGDIEDTLAELAKGASGGFAIGSLLGKSKFGGLDIKRVYFGNWLRDYSQAVDIASLKKLQVQVRSQRSREHHPI